MGEGGWESESHWWIARPGRKNENLPANSPLLELQNDLGADGWELASELIQSSRVGNNNGWLEASVPVEMLWTFKRPVGSSATTSAVDIQADDRSPGCSGGWVGEPPDAEAE